jgi:hypothetical protein
MRDRPLLLLFLLPPSPTFTITIAAAFAVFRE